MQSPLQSSDPESLDIDVVVEHPGWDTLDLSALVSRAAAAALAHLGLDAGAETPVEIVVLATSDEAVAELNAAFRGKPAPTNVLSWPAQSLAPARPGAVPPLPLPDATGALTLGDVALAFETCEREAREAGKELAAHVTHLTVHAILHLLGYDHISEADAALMERRETEILSSLGFPDPYTIPG